MWPGWCFVDRRPNLRLAPHPETAPTLGLSWSRVRGSNSPPHDYKSPLSRPGDAGRCRRVQKHAVSALIRVQRIRRETCRGGQFVDTSWTASAVRRPMTSPSIDQQRKGRAAAETRNWPSF